MKQTLKIAVPIVVLMAVVFGITFFSRYSPKDAEVVQDAPTEPPLRFGSTTRMWNPMGSLQDQHFPGYYEVHADALGLKNRTAFWFENRNAGPVTMQLANVSCQSCSGGRVAAIPPPVTKQILEMSVLSGLPCGLFSGFPVGMVGPAANLAPDRLTWQSYSFKDNPHAAYKVPAANNADGWSPQWGILELLFSPSVGPKTLTADFFAGVDGAKQPSPVRFEVAFEGVEAFDLTEKVINVGELSDSGETKNFEVVLFSSTRGPGGITGLDLQPPSVRVDLPAGQPGEPGPFVTVGQPVRIPDSELEAISIGMSLKNNRPLRAVAAYRMTVTVTPKVGDQRVDLGPLERGLWFAVPGVETRKGIRVTGLVRGAVWLEENRKELLVNDRFSSGAREEFLLFTQNRDAELVEIPELRKPDGLQVELKKLPPGLERGKYSITLTVPEKKYLGGWAGAVVLELKGPNPQRIRIPVRGRGER